MKTQYLSKLFVLLLALCQLGAGIDVKGQLVLQNAAAATGNGTAVDVTQYPSVGIQVTITNTATVTFEASADNQTTWNATNCTPINSTTATTTATASGAYQCALAGMDHFRARISAWTSGTVTVTANLLAASKGGGAGPAVGTVTTSGSPASGQVSFFTGAATISGDTNLTWDNSAKTLAFGTGNAVTITTAALTGNRTFTLPDANSNPVVPDTGASNNFLTAIAATGVISKAQPAFTNISGTATTGQGGTGVTDFTFSGNTHKACTTSGTLTSSDLVSFDASGNCIDSGIVVPANSILSLTNTAAYAAIASTNTETYFAIANDGKIPAARLNTAGVRLEVEAAGIYSTNGATDTIAIKVKLCTVSGCGSGTVVQVTTTGTLTPGSAVTNQGWNFRVVCNTYSTGASGTLDCQGRPGAVLFTALTTVIVDDIVNTAASSAIDLTAIEYVSVSATWNNNSSNNTITLRNWNAKVY